MSFLGYVFFLLLVNGAMVSSSVQWFLYPLPIPGRTLTGVVTSQANGLAQVSSVANNGIITPFSNFHFQVRNAQDGSYHFGYDAEKSYREEKRDAFGVVTGRYGYLDPNGVHRIVEYIADHNGYRARSTNQFFVESTPIVSPAVVAPVVQQPQQHQPPPSTIQVIGPIPKPISQFY